jgi:cyclohexanecarboxylate-CoA ligase
LAKGAIALNPSVDARVPDLPDPAARAVVPAAIEAAPLALERLQARARAGLLAPRSLIIDDLDRFAAARGDQVALVDCSRGRPKVFDFAGLHRSVGRIATALMRAGVAAGEPVAFQLPNWWEFVALQLALVRLGAVSCPLMPIFRERELSFVLRQTGARLLVVPERFRRTDHVALVRALAPSLPRLETVYVVEGGEGGEAPAWRGRDGRFRPFAELLDAEPAGPEADAAWRARRPAPDAITQLLYTSGTTGEPKGVLHTHRSLLDALDLQIEHFCLGEEDVIFVPSPVAHQTGFLYGFWLALHLGATAVYQDIWSGEVGHSLMDDWGVTFVQAATPFLADLCEVAARRGRGPGRLRLFVATGASVPRVLAQQAQGRLHAMVAGAFGTTESGLITAGTPRDPSERAWQTDGCLLPGTGMRVVDEAGRDLPPGRPGRFLVRSPGMFVGYLGHPDWYARAFVDGDWLDTGDLAVIDPDGYMSIKGRSKDVINRGGEKIPVAEVEDVLYGHPGVAEVAVVAMPDPRFGERACAYIVPRDGAAALSLAEVQRHLAAAGMAKQYWPERVELISSLPRTPSGKVQKFLLRERIAATLAEEVRRQA